MKTMKIETVFGTLLGAWGGDAPPEAIWTANELMQYVLGKDDIIMLDEEQINSEEFMAQLEKE